MALRPTNGAQRRRSAYLFAALLIAVPWAALLAVPFYARLTPTLVGFPMFYWWTSVWIVAMAGGTYAAHCLISRASRGGRR